MSNSFFSPIDRTQSDTTTSGQRGPESDSNEWVLHIPQSSKTRASPSHCFMSYQGDSLGEAYLSAEMQLVHSTALF